MFRLPEARALINRLGFNNEGLDAFIHNVQRAQFRKQHRATPMLLGLNIGKTPARPSKMPPATILRVWMAYTRMPIT